MAFRGPYIRAIGSPYSAMGALGDIELQQRKLDALGAGDPYGSIAKEGTMLLGDLVGLFRKPQRQQEAQQATLKQAAEMLAPDLAKEQGITPEAAYQQIAGGVREPEAPYKGVLRFFGIGDEPEGEPYPERVAKLQGMAARLGFHRKDEAAARDELNDLMTQASKLDDPSPLMPFIRRAAERAGYGDITGGLRFPHKKPTNQFEWLEQGGVTPREWMERTHRDQMSEYERAREDFTSGDPRRHKFAKEYLWGRRGRGGRSGMPDDARERQRQRSAITRQYEYYQRQEFQHGVKAIESDPTLVTPEQKRQAISDLVAGLTEKYSGWYLGTFDQPIGRDPAEGIPDYLRRPEDQPNVIEGDDDDSDAFIDGVLGPQGTPTTTSTSTTLGPPTTTTLGPDDFQDTLGALQR